MNSVILQNGIFGGMEIISGVGQTNDTTMPYSSGTLPMATVAYAQFNLSLGAGRLQTNATKVVLCRKKILDPIIDNETPQWVTLFSLPLDSTVITNNYGRVFILDNFAKTDAVYEYYLSFLDNNGNEVLAQTVQVLSQFCGAYIADGANSYEISEGWQIPDYNRIQKSMIYEPYGRKYPVVAYNALTNYESGSDMAILRSENNRSNKTNNYLDRISQTKVLREFNNFLTNRKTKVRKDFNGNIAVVVILNAVPSSFVQELGNGISQTQFSWVEVGEFTDSDFKNLGITNSFAIYGF